MTSFSIDKKFYIGASKNGNWASVYTYKPRNDHFLEEKGEIFAVISLKGPRGFNASTAGNLLLDFLHESYFEGKDTSPLICLENAVVSTAKKLAEIVDNDQNVGDVGIHLDICAVSVVGKLSYIVNMGQGGLYLFRNDNLVFVNPVLRDPSGDGFIKSASGVVEKGDVYLLMTEQGIDAYTKDELIESTSTYSEILLKNKALEDESNLGILMMGVEVEMNDSLETQHQNVEVISKFIKPDKSLENQKISDVEDFDEVDNVEEVNTSLNSRFQSGSLKVNLDEDALEKPSFFENLKMKLTDFASKSKEKIKDMKFSETLKDKWENLKPQDSEDTTFMYLVKNIRYNIVVFYGKAKKVIWDDFLQMDQGIYLKNARRGTNWRFIIVLALITIILLFIGIRGISARNENARKVREVEQSIESSSKVINEMLPKINSILGVVDVYNRERTNYQTQINQNRESLTKAKEYKIEEKKIDDLLTKLSELETKLNRQVSIGEPEILVDFVTKVGERSNPSDFTIKDGRIYVTDEGRGVVYSTDLTGGDLKELSKELKSPKSIAINSDGEIIASDTDASEPFFLINPSTGVIRRYSGILATNLNSVKQIETFNLNGTERIYFLKGSGTAVQYIEAVGAGYAGAFDRLDDTSFNNARDLEISDGKVYILQPGRGIQRFVGATEEQYNLFGLSSGEISNINNSSAIDVEGFYVVYGNSSGKSIVFATKSRGDDVQISDYVAQIVYKGDKDFLNNIKEVYVDYTGGNVYVLDGTKLLRLDYKLIQPFMY